MGNCFVDVLKGSGGADAIQGADGTDFINVGAGNDTLAGGLGADTFIIDAFDGVDTITDFEANGPTQDALDLTELLNSGGDWNDSGLEAAIELGYVRFTQVGANVDVSVDLGGFAGAGGPAEIGRAHV